MKKYDAIIASEYKVFYETKITGEIEEVGIKHHGTMFKIRNNSFTFVFYPYTNQYLNNGLDFESIAKKGIKVNKPAFSDTIFLIKDNIVFKYLFENRN